MKKIHLHQRISSAMNLEFRHLNLVQTVVEEGGLTRAGKRLGLSQSALSHQLRDVEEQFGVSLFHRIGRRLALAPAGERILQTARLVIPEIERAELDLRQNSGQVLGTIRLAAECYTCYQWLPAIARRFGRTHPGVDLRLVCGATVDPVRALLKGSLDIAVISQAIDDQRLKLTKLFDDQLMAITAAAHPLADRKYLRAKDFKSETLISSTPLSSTLLFLKILRPAGLRPKEVSEIPLTEAILEIVKAGFGLAVLPRWIVQPHLGSGEYRAIPITARGLRRKWYAVIRSGRKPPDHLAAFLQTLRDESQPAVSQLAATGLRR
jgi:LysR family transcriptional regulator, regulator for metE and metH